MLSARENRIVPTYDNWSDPVRLLRKRIEVASPIQIELAKQLNVRIQRRAPKLIAAAVLSETLAEPLCLGDESPPSAGQLSFLDDLADYLQRDFDPPASRRLASAWIQVLSIERAIEALTTLQLQRGDIVRRISEPDDDLAEVVSIGDDGTVYLGLGRRASPHQIEVVGRVDDPSLEAAFLRQEAREVRQRRASVSGPRLGSLLRDLEPYRVTRSTEATDALVLAQVLDSATDERPLQRFLGDNPHCLASLVRSTYGTFVIPLPRLGSEYVPDFAVAYADSLGVNWLLVELESPSVPLATLTGNPAPKLRTALRQISDWRDWLDGNLDYARRARSEQGLGLAGIDGRANALILIGCSEERHAAFERFRRRSIHESRLTIHTYSWLVQLLGQRERSLIGPLEFGASDF